ncbi:MAG: hypothetical protein A3E37_01295 [Candidatus Andersenbacteria bacterium RIFCSPHIGHO2_12_FULL_46_9]|nr:MAG: hypothetical protein UW94_C0007G0064 [Parcubacteria group bacterium GW2011_GWA2_45_14]OGY33057.1 MAG: hypothetical protein A3B76_01450 [Candidatus Andersenbacteria bacterium RIFCSPHIGHO2_02_FULL_46_16]OGY37581.1 MAG: hypothetical protein A3E37_01295 [Candidatus Andersenbacteria bacterium RIFCSPHIGHO2_12_FULL_46_9]OGY37970.1 MAG: hypothetical protein A3I08_00540 [Candidatus Andersenbacteria bacterium RIFCSPLOWO2_02_FULL_46_11]OGY39466.1 MAG: hypothetical protein A3G57_04075 [Candidatus A
MSEKLPRFNGGPEFAPQKPEDGLESTEKEAIEKVLSNLTRINTENGHDIDKLNDGHNQRVIAGAYDFYRGLSKKAYQALDVREKGKADAARNLSWLGYSSMANRQNELRGAVRDTGAMGGRLDASGWDISANAFAMQDILVKHDEKNSSKYKKMVDKFGYHSPLYTQPLFPYSKFETDKIKYNAKTGRTECATDLLMNIRLEALSILEHDAYVMIGHTGEKGNIEEFVRSSLRNSLLADKAYGIDSLYLEFKKKGDNHIFSIYGKEPLSADDLPLVRVVSFNYPEQENYVVAIRGEELKKIELGETGRSMYRMGRADEVQ